MTLRLAYGRLNQESNALSPIASTIEDFDGFHFLEGEALQKATSLLGKEISGLSRACELSGFRASLLGKDVEAVPLFSSWAMPGGSMEEECYLKLRQRLEDSLRRAGKLDGIYLALHGAQQARGKVRNPEEKYLETVREVVGDIPLVTSYDLHGLMTAPKVEIPDIVTAYRTNPHRDLVQVGWRSGQLLQRMVRGKIRPVTRWRSLPMVRGGGINVDFLAPLRSIFKRMKEMERDPRVLYVSLFTVHLWLDSPDLGWSVVVVTDSDPALADRLADELADRAWETRHIEPPKVLTPESAIKKARRLLWARRLGSVYFVDVSDVIGAGAPGENTQLLKSMLEHAQGLTCYVPVRDAEVVSSAWNRVGEELDLELGGRFDPETSPGLELRATVVRRVQTENFGRAVVLQAGSTFIAVTEKPPIAIKPNFFTDLGLNPFRADVVVVKTFFHFRWFHLLYTRRTLGVQTRGSTDLDGWKHTKIEGLVHPRDHLDDWRAEDLRRRSRPQTGTTAPTKRTSA